MEQKQTLLEQVLASKTPKKDLQKFTPENWEELFSDMTKLPQETEEDKQSLLDIQKEIYPSFRFSNEYFKKLESQSKKFVDNLFENPSVFTIIKLWDKITPEERTKYIENLGIAMIECDGYNKHEYKVQMFSKDKLTLGYVAGGKYEDMVKYDIDVYNYWLENEDKMENSSDAVKAVLKRLKALPDKYKDADGKIVDVPLGLKPSAEKYTTININKHPNALNFGVYRVMNTLYHEFTHLKQKKYDKNNSESIEERIVDTNRLVYCTPDNDTQAYGGQPMEYEAFFCGYHVGEYLQEKVKETQSIENPYNKEEFKKLYEANLAISAYTDGLNKSYDPYKLYYAGRQELDKYDAKKYQKDHSLVYRAVVAYSESMIWGQYLDPCVPDGAHEIAKLLTRKDIDWEKQHYAKMAHKSGMNSLEAMTKSENPQMAEAAKKALDMIKNPQQESIITKEGGLLIIPSASNKYNGLAVGALKPKETDDKEKGKETEPKASPSKGALGIIESPQKEDTKTKEGEVLKISPETGRFGGLLIGGSSNTNKTNGKESSSKLKVLSFSAKELKGVFKNLETYQNKAGNDEKIEKFVSDFSNDTAKILEIYKSNKNDREITQILKENLHLVSGTTNAGAWHNDVDMVSFFMVKMAKEMLKEPKASIECRADVATGLGRMLRDRGYNYHTNKAVSYEYAGNIMNVLNKNAANYGNEETLDWISLENYAFANAMGENNFLINSMHGFENKDVAQETVNFILKEGHQNNLSALTLERTMKSFHNPIVAKKIFDHVEKNWENDMNAVNVSLAVMKTHPDLKTTYIKASNLVRDFYKDDPLKALMKIERPLKDSPEMVKIKYINIRGQLFADIASKMKTAKSGDKYDPKILGKELAKTKSHHQKYYDSRELVKNIDDFISQSKNKDLIDSFKIGDSTYRKMLHKVLPTSIWKHVSKGFGK